jgi:SAM-dependent methyltransferase
VQFDFEATFGDDYLYFYRRMLTDEVSDGDTDDIVALLGLAPGDSVLDAPCGHGRISNRLADRGCDVVGVDASELFLGVAREAGSAVDYRRGDLRDLPVDGPFDAALSWFTSFGYFDDDGNRRVLSEYRRVLRPGGRLLIEMHNRDNFVRFFAPAPYSHSCTSGTT